MTKRCIEYITCFMNTLSTQFRKLDCDQKFLMNPFIFS
jgi:hypothetical protein